MENKVFHSVYRGDIFYADLEPVIGSEQANREPVRKNSGLHLTASILFVLFPPCQTLFELGTIVADTIQSGGNQNDRENFK